MLPSPPSEFEAIAYYLGLPSRPALVARTSTIPLKGPTGQWGYRRIKELHPVGNHAIKEVWEDNLALKIHTLLDSKRVKWTSTDVVRIGFVDESFTSVILWIGVIPTSLSGDNGVVVASGCKDILTENGITDVEVEIRESAVTRLIGPKLLAPGSFCLSQKQEVEAREPLTTALGLPISALSAPWTQGTGGFFVTEGRETRRLLLITARHVIFTPDKSEHFEHGNNSQPRHNIALFSDAAFSKYTKSILDEIEETGYTIRDQEARISAFEGRDDPKANEKRKEARSELGKAKKVKEQLETLHKDVSTYWGTRESRILGHVILSPPINVGSGGYTEDWAVIEIDDSKIDASNFKGNAIDLGALISIYNFARMMCPHNPNSFDYPLDRLLQLEGIIPDEDIRHPTGRDQYGQPCLTVIKRGSATGLTVGRANDVCSYVRTYCDSDDGKTSKEWAIFQFDSKSGAFSAKGDSGSVIVDGLGRIGGLLTSGAGTTSDTDITYATPISFLLERMQAEGLYELNINPVLPAQAPPVSSGTP